MIFIQFKREQSARLLALRRLHRRMSINHPQFIAILQDLNNANGSHCGKEYIDTVLSTIHFPNLHMIFPNIRFIEKKITKELPAINRKLNKLTLQLSDECFSTHSKKINPANVPFKSHSICQQYGVLPSDLIQGIFCSQCEGPMVKESNRIYVCSHCLYIPDNPFTDVMIDWFTLIGNQISNQQLRFLSGVESSHTVGWFMKNSQFPHSGKNKGTIYHVNQQEQQNFILHGKKQLHHIKQKS